MVVCEVEPITPLDFIKMSGTEMDDWHHVVIEYISWYSGLCPTPMKPALKSRCRLVIPDVDKRKEEVHLGHLLLLPSIEQLLENWQQKDPERSQRGAGNRVAVSEQRILVKFVATVQIVERIAPHGSRMAVLAEQEAPTPWTLR